MKCGCRNGSRHCTSALPEGLGCTHNVLLVWTTEECRIIRHVDPHCCSTVSCTIAAIEWLWVTEETRNIFWTGLTTGGTGQSKRRVQWTVTSSQWRNLILVLCNAGNLKVPRFKQLALINAGKTPELEKLGFWREVLPSVLSGLSKCPDKALQFYRQ